MGTRASFPSLLALGCLFAAGCPSTPPGDGHTLWLAPNGSELRLKLQSQEPDPY